MTKGFGLIPRVVMSIWAMCLVAGCGGGGMSAIGITPSTPQVMDSGQTLTITAAVVNDTTAKGASFAVTGGGTLTTPTRLAVSSTSYESTTYTAPAVTAQAAVVVTATALNTPSQTASVNITVNPAIAIATTTLASGMVGTAYTATISVTGGTAPLSLSVTSGTLPGGLKLNAATGAITGTPTAFGTFNFTVAVVDAATVPVTMSQAYSLTIAPQVPSITTTTLPNAVAGTAYSQQLAFVGGGLATPVFTETGALPAGLTLSATGLISGTPTNASAGATYPFTVTVTVGTQTSTPVSLAITVPPLPVVTTTTLPSGNVGSAYSKQLNYNGGAGGTVSWAITAGSLPAGSGLTLSSSGLIAGTPTTATTYSFSVAVTVGTQTSAAQALTLTVNSLIITSASTATGEVGLPFGFQLTAAGGKPPYTWALAAGSAPLPAGLSLATSGLISGTPTTANGSPFGGIVVQATDTVGGTAPQTMTISIAAARSNANNGQLSGQYAFLVSGFDANHNPLAAAGKFTADGNGNITGGAIDANGTGAGALASNVALSPGTFSVGPDGRGKLTLVTPGGTATFVIAVNGIVSGTATGGYMIEYDNTGQSLTGVFAQQTASAFTTASITGGYAFGASGFAANSTASSQIHRAAAGEFQFNGTGGITSAEYVESSSTVGGPLNPKSVAIAIGANGRGTLMLVQPNGLPTQNFVVYVVSTGRFFLLSSDPANGTTGVNDLLYGQALQQTIASGNFVTTSLNGTAVVRTEALDATLAGTIYPDVRVGIYTFTGAGTVRLAGDENAGGAPTTLALSGSYSVAANGRVTVSFNNSFGGCADCVGGGNMYFYLVGANQGFVMDFTTAGTSGSFDPQTATTYTNASFSGVYGAGSVLPLTQAATYVEASVNASGSGAVTGTADANTSGTLLADVPVSGSDAVAASGRATSTAIGSGNAVIYVVSPTKAVALDLGAASPVVIELTHQ